MTSSSNLVPPPLGDVLARLPQYPGAVLFVTGLNLVLARQLSSEVTGMLQGKRLRLRVTDTHWAFDFAWRNGCFVAHPNASGSACGDLTISASMYDFLQLARRREDPDTLFFNRRLAMEGDTELGLLVKNSLDAMELPPLTLDSLLPSRIFSGLRARFASR